MPYAPCSLPPVAVWSSELAVGDDGFVEKVKANLGRLASRMTVNQDLAHYGQPITITDNNLAWQIFDDNEI